MGTALGKKNRCDFSNDSEILTPLYSNPRRIRDSSERRGDKQDQADQNKDSTHQCCQTFNAPGDDALRIRGKDFHPDHVSTPKAPLPDLEPND